MVEYSRACHEQSYYSGMSIRVQNVRAGAGDLLNGGRTAISVGGKPGRDKNLRFKTGQNLRGRQRDKNCR
jgi:hypothetical protein